MVKATSVCSGKRPREVIGVALEDLFDARILA